MSIVLILAAVGIAGFLLLKPGATADTIAAPGTGADFSTDIPTALLQAGLEWFGDIQDENARYRAIKHRMNAAEYASWRALQDKATASWWSAKAASAVTAYRKRMSEKYIDTQAGIDNFLGRVQNFQLTGTLDFSPDGIKWLADEGITAPVKAPDIAVAPRTRRTRLGEIRILGE